MFFDALRVKIRDEGTVRNKAVHLALGVRGDGTKDALIDQNPRVEAREAISMPRAAIRGEPINYIGPRIQVVLKENIPDR